MQVFGCTRYSITRPSDEVSRKVRSWTQSCSCHRSRARVLPEESELVWLAEMFIGNPLRVSSYRGCFMRGDAREIGWCWSVSHKHNSRPRRLLTMGSSEIMISISNQPQTVGRLCKQAAGYQIQLLFAGAGVSCIFSSKGNSDLLA